jgi:predicted CxxxxCH...CXXCH cytochrome family protein
MRARSLVGVLGLLLASGCLPDQYNPNGPGTAGQRVHPVGYAAADVHGPEMTLQKQDCRSCHGADLTGGTGPSCDSCHTPADPPAWRTKCTFCHGGTDEPSGAPPRHLDGTSAAASAKFPAHTAHVTSRLTTALDCMQCHVKAVDVLSPDHAFDSTPGRAETDFGAGLSPQAQWDGRGGCSNLYCHGTGRGDDGAISVGAARRDCTSCHAGQTSGATGWATMSGQHALHLGTTGVGCADCHDATTKDGTTIADVTKHLDGQRQVAFGAQGAAVTYNEAARACTGACHGHTHATAGWLSTNGRVHPAGFSAPAVHGAEMELQRQDCRGCHGATLTGGSGPSCDSCHKQNWRTSCTYCHGGGANQTGAPPRDLAAAMSTVSQSFRAHTAHVTQRIAVAFDCTQCHKKPTDVLSVGHAFDATKGAAEVTLASGLSPAGTYDGNGGCANLYCHGNGRVNGAIRDGAAALSCAGCHPSKASGAMAWATMSGDHRRHLAIADVTCADCHVTVTADGNTIAQPALHVDGKRQVAFKAAGFTFDATNRRCAGTCHGEGHNNQTW